MNAVALRELMQKMQAADPDFRVFGSEKHHYQFGPARSEQEIQAFEAQHRVKLPADYRGFLQNVGDGGTSQSRVRVLAARNGPGPGCGLFPLAEAVLDCDPRRPFPLTKSTKEKPLPDLHRWGTEEPFPGVLQICYQGSACFSYLVVNGSTYGTIWEQNHDLYPTGLSFEQWYTAWTDRLVQHALPRLAREIVVQHVSPGMTKNDVIALCDGKWRQHSHDGVTSFLSCTGLSTQFALDENEKVVRVIRHSV